jgi:hypothetical protein
MVVRLPAASILALIIFAATVLLFTNHVGADFLQFDDDVNITGNPHIRGLTADNWKWIWTDASYVRRYIPLAWLGWALQFQIFGPSAWSWHLVNILLHAVNAVLIFFLIKKLLERAIPSGTKISSSISYCAAAGALVWSLHPLRVEAVAWASGRVYCQALTFLLLSLLFYFRFTEGGNHRRAFYALSILCYGASLLSYPIALCCALLYIIVDIFPLRRLSCSWPTAENDGKRILLEKLPFFIVAGLVLSITLLARAQASTFWQPAASLNDFGVLERVLQAFYIWACYLWKTLLPFHLSPVYTTLFSVSAMDVQFWGSAVLVGCISGLVFWQRRRWPWLLAGWLAYLVLLLPMSGFTEHPHFPSDRYSLLPSVVISILLAGAFSALSHHLKAQAAVYLPTTLVIGVLAFLSYQQLRAWQNSETLFQHVLSELKTHPYRHDIHNRLARYYQSRDMDRQVIEQYKLSLEAFPAQSATLSRLSFMLLATDDPILRNGAEAVGYALRACAETHDSDPQLLIVLAGARAECGQFPEALAAMEKARAVAEKAGNTKLAAASIKIMESYKSGKTLREYLASNK